MRTQMRYRDNDPWLRLTYPVLEKDSYRFIEVMCGGLGLGVVPEGS